MLTPRHLPRSALPALAVPALLALALPAGAAALRYSSPEGTARFATDPAWLALGFVATAQVVLLVLLLVGPTTWRGAKRIVVRGAPAPGARELLALASLTVGGLALRLLLSPPAPILSTFNDIKHLHDAMCLAGQARACELTPAYPFGVTAVHGLVLRLTGPSLLATYVTNAVLAALTIPATWLLATLLLGGRRAAGWLAAVAVVGLPLHIRFSASGAYTIGFAFFATVGLAFLLLFARSQRPRHLWIAGLALALMIQSRYEAVGFAAPILLATLVAVPRFWRPLVSFRVRWHALFLVLVLVGAAAAPLLQVLQPTELAGFRGETDPTWRLGSALVLPLAYLALGHLLDRAPLPHVVRWLGGAAALAGLLYAAHVVAFLPTSFGPAPDPWPVFAYNGLHEPSFAERGIPLLNPRAVTLPAMLLMFLGVVGGLHPARRGPVAVGLMWFGFASALGLQKNTGSIPFEHLRTAVDGVPGVAILAACGGLAVADLLRRPFAGRLHVPAVAALSVALLAGPLFSLPLLRARDYNNQRQIDFLARTLPTLPEPAIVVFPNRTNPGEHRFAALFRIPEVWWTIGRTAGGATRGPAGRAGGGERRDRFVGTVAALRAPDELVALREKGWTVLFWEGLACYRTAGRPGERRSDCEEMHWTFRLTPIAEEVIANRPFESDFHEVFVIRGETVPLRVYRVEGVAEGR